MTTLEQLRRIENIDAGWADRHADLFNPRYIPEKDISIPYPEVPDAEESADMVYTLFAALLQGRDLLFSPSQQLEFTRRVFDDEKSYLLTQGENKIGKFDGNSIWVPRKFGYLPTIEAGLLLVEVDTGDAYKSGRWLKLDADGQPTFSISAV